MKLNICDLEEYLDRYISSSPTIIYFGVGSEFYEFKTDFDNSYTNINNTTNMNKQKNTQWEPK